MGDAFRQKLKDELIECRNSLDAVMAESAVGAEEAAKQQIIEPIIETLGWRSRTVWREYKINAGKNSKKVDYALLDSQKNPAVLIEAKALGNLNDKSEDQLFDYARNQFFDYRIEMLLVLTDGREWLFYLTWEKGTQADKQFYKFDLEKDDMEIIADKLIGFLSRQCILDGTAQKSAGEEWKLHNNRAKLREILPEILKEFHKKLPKHWARDIADKAKENLDIDFPYGDINSAVWDYYKSLRAEEPDYSDFDKPSIAPNKKPARPITGKSASKFVIYFKDRSYGVDTNAATAFADVIAAFGVAKVYQVCREEGITMTGGYYVVMKRNEFPKYYSETNKTQLVYGNKERDGYRVMTHGSKQELRKTLLAVAKAMSLKIEVEFG